MLTKLFIIINIIIINIIIINIIIIIVIIIIIIIVIVIVIVIISITWFAVQTGAAGILSDVYPNRTSVVQRNVKDKSWTNNWSNSIRDGTTFRRK